MKIIQQLQQKFFSSRSQDVSHKWWLDLYLAVFMVALVINPWGFTYYELPKLLYIRTVVSLALALVAINAWWREHPKIYWNSWVYLLAFCWLASQIISTIFSGTPELSFWGSYTRMQGLISVVYYLLHFFIILHYLKFRPGGQIRIFQTIFWVGVTVSIYALLQGIGIYLFPAEANPAYGKRLFSTLGHPNFLGEFLIFPFWIGLALVSGKIRNKWVYWLGVGLVVWGLIMTGNRATVLGILVSLGLYLTLINSFFRKFRFFVWGTLLTLLTVFIVIIAPRTATLESRFILWRSSLPLIGQHLLLGSGPETLGNTFQHVYPKELMKTERVVDIVDRAHNEQLDVLLSQGLIGLIIYVLCWFFLIRNCIRTKLLHDPVTSVAFFAIISLLLSNVFSFSVVTHWLLFFTFVAIILNHTANFRIISIKTTSQKVIYNLILIIIAIFGIKTAWGQLHADNQLSRVIDELNMGNAGKVIEDINSAQFIQPQHGYISYLYSRFLTQIGMSSGNNTAILEGARKLLDQSAFFTGENREYYLQLAEIMQAQGKIAEARHAFAEAINFAPTHPSAYQQWGKFEYLQKNYPSAQKLLQKYLELLPEYWQWKPLLDSLSRVDQEKYRIFMKDTPNLRESMRQLAKTYEISDPAKAEYYLKMAE